MRRRARLSQSNLTHIPGPSALSSCSSLSESSGQTHSNQPQILRVLKESRSNLMPISVCLVHSQCDTTAEIKEQAYSILRKSSQHSTVSYAPPCHMVSAQHENTTHLAQRALIYGRMGDHVSRTN
ncbi:hypothetical protein BD310DRAFT_722108 [Dichomitus squalens]|uniref:Uncharacterized protein n=1 Tax=Dichomitus squalens TaxID=114155 RepID=A0A4Q9PL23_9APHY|nr:hypothetical protein BD310DRAFT_722108 [Dichomitus squalens]